MKCHPGSTNTPVAHRTLLSLYLLNQKPCLIELTDVFPHRAALFYEAGEHLTWGVEGRVVSRRVAPKRPRVDISTLAQQVANHLSTVLIVTRTCNNGGQTIVLSTFCLIAWIANNHSNRLLFGIIGNLKGYLIPSNFAFQDLKLLLEPKQMINYFLRH